MLFSKKLNVALKRLNTLHEDYLSKEAKLKEEIEKAKQERNAELDKGRKEAKEMVEVAKKEVQNLHASASEEAHQSVARIIKRGKDEVEKLKRDFQVNAQAKAIDLSIQVIKHTFSAQGKEALQRQFIEEIIQEIDALSEEKFTVKTENVEIKTSYPLNDKEREQLKKVLSKKLGMPVKLEEKQDKELIMGLFIKIGALTIDGSLANRLKKVIPYLKKEA
tara:strand:+ start:108 stop:767 length:660 start_codon:yes stop_codon:yes gene_type:complete